MTFPTPNATEALEMPASKAIEKQRGSHQITIRVPLPIWRGQLKPLIEAATKADPKLSRTDVILTLVLEALAEREKSDSR
jgi:hypothetical protein